MNTFTLNWDNLPKDIARQGERKLLNNKVTVDETHMKQA